MSDETVLEVNKDGSTQEVEVQKIKTVRASGMPVELDKLKEFQDEWKNGFDAIYDKKKDMTNIQKEVDEFQQRMNEKYDTIVEWDMLKTDDDWKNAIAEYGSILVSTHIETGELMYVIMDQGI